MIGTEIWGVVTTAFFFGLTSSFHCVTMCGPLIGTVHSLHVSKSTPYLYQLGRIISYASLGGILGIMGKGANALGELKDLQGISAILSISLLAFAGIRLLTNAKPIHFLPSFQKLLSPLISFLRKHDMLSALGFVLGLVSAFLPCGVLYPAYAVAFATGHVWSGSLVMVGFFLGTFPALFGLSFGIQWFKENIPSRFVTYLGLALIIISMGFLMTRITHVFHSESCDHIEG
jgi:sulfite exporter TauE/SafE